MTAGALPAGHLRRAVPGDAARLALLGGATFLHAFANDHPGDALVAHAATEHSPAWYESALAAADTALWIVETPLGAPIGYAMLAPPIATECTRRGDLELKRLYVLGPWQSGGWGVRLLDAVESEARGRGAERLLLSVYVANLGAQRFYRRQGYAATHCQTEFMVGDVAFTDLIFAKPL